MSHYSDATGGVDFGLCCAIGAAGAAEEVDIASLIGKLGTYNELRAEAAGTGLQVHHLIEKRFMAIEEIKEMFAKKVKVESLDPAMELKALGLDSLDLVELIMDIEEKYGVEFGNEELMEFKTVGDVLASIEKKL